MRKDGVNILVIGGLAAALLALAVLSGCDGGGIDFQEPCDQDYDEDCEAQEYVTCLPRERYLAQLAQAQQAGFELGVESVEVKPPRDRGRGHAGH